MAGLFITAFDNVFDRARRGRPHFVRAGLVSCGILAAMSLRWIWVHEARAEPVMESIFRTWSNILGNSVALAILMVCLNWIGDYLSLWETRVVLDKLKTARSWVLQVFWLACDLLATIAIYWVGVTIALVIIEIAFPGYFVYSGEQPLVLQIWVILWSVFTEGGVMLNHKDSTLDPFAIFFHTSLFTSVWAWALMAGFILWSLFRPLLLRVSQLRTLYKKFPVTCVMAVGALFAGCVFAAVDLIL